MNKARVGGGRRLENLLDLLDIPGSYYESAVQRYESLNRWFKREGSVIAKFDPAVYPQGSFRLGLVIRPLTPEEEYDLDVVCHLVLVKKSDLTQRQVKHLVGVEVRAYAQAHGIKAPVEERKRAWRLDYADGVKFHIDIVPCVPEDEATITALIERHDVVPELAESAVALTCTSHASYTAISSNWPTSNPIGFGIWFDQRMADIAQERREALVKMGQYEDAERVPTYALKTPLQRAIQLLKRHRDTMFKDAPELKPISVIITTLAAHAYEGESELEEAVSGILRRMPDHVARSRPRVKNPANPGEDFADKWTSDPLLEQNFWAWHKQACRDFAALSAETDSNRLIKLAESRFALPMSTSTARELTGASALVPVMAPHVVVRDSPKPWRNDNA